MTAVLEKTKHFVGRTIAGVTWIGRREPCSQDCDISSLQSFLRERPWPEQPWLLCHSHCNLCSELPQGSPEDLSLHLSVKQGVAVQNSSCGNVANGDVKYYKYCPSHLLGKVQISFEDLVSSVKFLNALKTLISAVQALSFSGF